MKMLPVKPGQLLQGYKCIFYRNNGAFFQITYINWLTYNKIPDTLFISVAYVIMTIVVFCN